MVPFLFRAQCSISPEGFSRETCPFCNQSLGPRISLWEYRPQMYFYLRGQVYGLCIVAEFEVPICYHRHCRFSDFLAKIYQNLALGDVAQAVRSSMQSHNAKDRNHPKLRAGASFSSAGRRSDSRCRQRQSAANREAAAAGSLPPSSAQLETHRGLFYLTQVGSKGLYTVAVQMHTQLSASHNLVLSETSLLGCDVIYLLTTLVLQTQSHAFRAWKVLDPLLFSTTMI